MTRGTKFACLCIHASPVAVPEGPVNIGHGYSVSGRAPGIDPSDWLEALGSFQIEEVTNSSLWIWIERASERADVLDAENQELLRRLKCFWWAFLLHEPPRIFSAWALSGRSNGGQSELRHVAKYDRVYNHQSVRTEVTLDTLTQAAETAEHYEQLVVGSGLRGRIRLGFAAFASGMQQRRVDPAHLCFQRALEGIFHPCDKRQFARRGAAVFRDASRADADATELLEAIYDMRSGFTHCESLATIFPDLAQGEAERRGIELRDATYTLAARTYRTVLRSSELVARFGREGQGDYWGKIVCGRKDPPFQIDLLPTDWQTNSSDPA
jgi:hypothetical protein